MNFGAKFIQPRFSSAYRKQTLKDLQDKIAHIVKELKKRHILKAFLTLNEVLEKWEMCPLEIPRKALEFFLFKKGTNPVNNVKMFPITLSRKCPCGVPIY